MKKWMMSLAFMSLLTLSACMPEVESENIDEIVENGGAYEVDVNGKKDSSETISEENKTSENTEEVLEKIEVVPPIEEKNSSLKVISTYGLKGETESFKKDVEEVSKIAHSFGGYISSKEIADITGSSLKEANISIKVPREKVGETIKEIREIISIESENFKSIDITDKYEEIDGKIALLEEREKRLLDLYARTNDIEEIIAIDEKIHEVSLEKDNEIKRRNKIEDRITFSKIDLNVLEVKKLTTAKETVEDSYSNKMKDRLYSSFKFIKVAIVEITLIIVVSFPFIILAGVLYYINRKFFSDKGKK